MSAASSSPSSPLLANVRAMVSEASGFTSTTSELTARPRRRNGGDKGEAGRRLDSSAGLGREGWLRGSAGGRKPWRRTAPPAV